MKQEISACLSDGNRVSVWSVTGLDRVESIPTSVGQSAERGWAARCIPRTRCRQGEGPHRPLYTHKINHLLRIAQVTAPEANSRWHFRYYLFFFFFFLSSKRSLNDIYLFLVALALGVEVSFLTLDSENRIKTNWHVCKIIPVEWNYIRNRSIIFIAN